MNSDAHRKSPKGRFWRRLRVWFRHFRITVLLLVLALVAIGGYLNHFGLPGFIKRPLQQKLRERGLNLEFSRLRLRWYRGIVADDVILLGTNNTVWAGFTARSAEVKLDYAALARLKLDVRGVVLIDGKLVWQPAPTNQSVAEPPVPMTISGITTDLRFLPGDEWSLTHFRAEYLGARFSVEGRIRHASALRNWAFFQSTGPQRPGAWAARLHQLHTQLARLRFSRPPEFHLSIDGDGTDLRSFSGEFTLSADAAETPWGEFEKGRLQIKLNPSATNESPFATITVAAARIRTQWGTLRELELNTSTAIEPQAEGQPALHLGDLGTGGIKVRLGGLNMGQTRLGAMSLQARFTPAAPPPTVDPALGAWAEALPYDVDLDFAAANVANDGLHADSVSATALWQPPMLTLTNLQIRGTNARLAAGLALNVVTRRLDFSGKGSFDFHQLNPLLTEKSRDWINKFSWQVPPHLELAGSLTLPAWTNQHPDWRGEVQPGIVLSGAVRLTNASCSDISARSITSHISYSNRVWRLPDLAVVRQEGALVASLQSDEVSHEYSIQLRGPFDFRALESQLGDKGRRGVGYFSFSGAPELDAEIHGSWSDPERLCTRASVVWTNFSFRDQHVDLLAASLNYTNKTLLVLNPRIERGKERATADGILFDFTSNRAWLTNGWTDTDPMAIATAIGPKVAAAVARYQFLSPPVARVSGVIPLKGEHDADLHFDIEGGPFRWMKINLPWITGHICWAHESVTLSNITASFYGGQAAGNAWFDVHQRGSTPFRFDLNTTNADLHALMTDLHSASNRLEGVFSGSLAITEANTEDWNSWNGHGYADLRNGLIWDTPVFGVMSTIMNSFIPGIGNSRASEAKGSFAITNSVIYTRDLDIRASGMRLLYDGTVDFHDRVNARVQAELLRDTWFVGKVVSTALWPVSKLFEYRVTGTLADPKPEPLYLIPRIFLAPLHPIKAFKGTPPEFPPITNAPPTIVVPELPENSDPDE